MFFFISKILSYLLSPVFWVILLMVLSLTARNRRRARKLLLAALLMFYFFSNHFIVHEVMRWWEAPDRADISLQQKYEAGIVLGGRMVTYDKDRDKITFRDNPDRVMQALRLYHEGRISKILIAGGPGHIALPGEYEAAWLAKYLEQLGVPPEDILVDSLSRNTRENAVNAAEILKRHGIRTKCLLFTSAWHMPRAERCFIKQEVLVEPYPTGRLAGSRKWDFDHLFVPHTISLQYWYLLIHEMTGYIVYRIAGYI